SYFWDMMEQAEMIRDSFFADDGSELRFTLKPIPPQRIGTTPPTVQSITIAINGERDLWNMGYTAGKEFSWPGNRSNQGASITVNTNQGNLTDLKEEGQWAWFRLLKRANIRRIDTYFELTWPLNKGSYQLLIRYQMETQSSKNPFHDLNSIFSYHCPETLDRN
ncbi:MAG: hypothetical protein EHM72_19045, partial [Calditrichaeota bacterium]